MGKKSAYSFLLSMLMLIAFSSASLASTGFYLHDNNQYWWYHSSDPHFYAVVPSNADRYETKTIFGYQFLELSWHNGSTLIEVGILPDSNTADVVDFVAKRWSPFLENPVVFANHEITTSNDLPTFFYGIEGNGPNGIKSMVRSVYFNNGNDVVYLAMYIENNRYQGDMRNHWIRAVNEFEW